LLTFVRCSAIFAGYIADATVIPKQASVVLSNQIYAHTFILIGVATIVVGILLAFGVAQLKRWTETHKYAS